MSNKVFNNKRRWAIDLTGRKGERGIDSLPSPPGYFSSITQVYNEASRQVDPSLVTKKIWDLALSPFKAVPMNLVMMFMAGSSIGIFPIMMVGMVLVRSIKALMVTNATFTFKPVDSFNTILYKFIYILGHLANCGVALYKFHSVGLLPTHASDWLAFQEPAIQAEYSYGGIAFT